MGLFGKSAQEKALEAQNAHLEQANATLTREKAEAVAALKSEKTAHANTRIMYEGEISRSERLAGRLKSAHTALRDITLLLTAKPSHAARKMARRAQDALPVELATRQLAKPVNGASGAVL